MARPLRIEYAGALYHITTRGNAKQKIFKNQVDQKTFLNLLTQVNKRYKWHCHAYCLMNNHYHLVIETEEATLSKGMRQLNGVYTQAYNGRHHRVGHLFQGRFKAILIEKETYLLEVCRYVVLNPVRAKIAQRPDAWEWSSYRGTAGIHKPHPCLTVEWILAQFGTSGAEARRRYQKFVQEGVGGVSLWKKVKGQSLLGEESFIEKVRPVFEGRKQNQEIPRTQRYLARPELEKMFQGITRGDKNQRDRLIQKAVEEYGYSQRAVADNLKMHYSSVSRIVNGNKMKINNKDLILLPHEK